MMNSLKKIFDRDTWDEIFESISKTSVFPLNDKEKYIILRVVKN
jgi:hypothetical protein